MSEPQTAAGRALLAHVKPDYTPPDSGKTFTQHILAIEAEAAALDVERLAEAISKAQWLGDPISFGGRTINGAARNIAAAYSEASDEPAAGRRLISYEFTEEHEFTEASDE